MATPQTGIFALGTRSHYYLEFDLRPATEPAALLAALGELREPKVTTGGANLVIGFGATLWAGLGREAPADFTSFEAIEGVGGVRAPSAQHDLWVWIHGASYDVVFDAARAVGAALDRTARLATEQPGFVYRESQDLTGFEDGTENPPLDEAPEVALVPDGEPGAGGSIAIVQKWVHDLGSFHDLDVHEQEKVFGRTKPDSEELDPLPPRAHVNRVQIEEDGEELEIFRRSTPFGTLTEHGLMFVGFSAEQSRFRKMLERILGVADGVADRLTDFSTPVGGAFYFVPALEAMRAAE